MTRAGLALLVLSFTLALGFGVIGPWATAHVAPLALAAMKASGIVVLGVLALTQGSRLLGAGLLLGALGDALLALPSQASFLAGAGAFLLGHLCYIALFLGGGIGVRAALRSPARVAALLALPAAGLASAALLFTPGSPLVLPLGAYSAVLTFMAMASFTLPWTRWIAMAGAVLFFVSDGFVAYDLFRPDTAASDGVRLVGWLVYWAGQAGICVGGVGLALPPAFRTASNPAIPPL